MEIETQIGHGPYIQDPQGLLGNTEIEANNYDTMHSDTCDNREMFQALYVTEKVQIYLSWRKVGLSRRKNIYFGS